MARARKRQGVQQGAGATLVENIRDRVVDFKRVPSDELLDNNKNWRLHPYAQQAAVSELLDQVGIVGALTAYHSERNGGALTLIDGHERRSHQADWPVLVLDVDDDEADLLLATLDPITAMAGTSPLELEQLLENVQAGTPALVDLLQLLDSDARALLDSLEDEGEPTGGGRELPEMELQPFEHYDYVVLLARNTYDWMALQDLLHIDNVQFTLPDGRSKRLGIGRVVDARRVIELAAGQDSVPARPPEPSDAAG